MFLICISGRYRETLLHGLERCLKRGDGAEKALAAETLAIVCLQLACVEDTEDLYTSFQPVLDKLVRDNTAAPAAHAKGCLSLGVIAFIIEDDVDSLNECMLLFESLFSGSFLKGNRCSPVLSDGIVELHAAALSAWSLLITVSPWSHVQEINARLLAKLPQLLVSQSVDLVVLAGEALALIHEIAFGEDDDAVNAELSQYIDRRQLALKFKELATYGSKYRANHVRRHQRAAFRSVQATVEGEGYDSGEVIGGELNIESWQRKTQYTVLKTLLNAGIAFHLKENRVIREVFGLGPVKLAASDDSHSSSSDHYTRYLMNAANAKVQSKARARNRDRKNARYY